MCLITKDCIYVKAFKECVQHMRELCFEHIVQKAIMQNNTVFASLGAENTGWFSEFSPNL